NIETALQNLSGTSVAHIEPNRNSMTEASILVDQNNISQQSETDASKKKLKTIPGISKWFEWSWPVTGKFARYICARSLPHLGVWNNFQPTQIAPFCKRPSLAFSEPSIPKTAWIMPTPKKSESLPNEITEEA
ncbi:45210_t:CDS:2, partial [Gigaspora margarita]